MNFIKSSFGTIALPIMAILTIIVVIHQSIFSTSSRAYEEAIEHTNNRTTGILDQLNADRISELNRNLNTHPSRTIHRCIECNVTISY